MKLAFTGHKKKKMILTINDYMTIRFFYSVIPLGITLHRKDNKNVL